MPEPIVEPKPEPQSFENYMEESLSGLEVVPEPSVVPAEPVKVEPAKVEPAKIEPVKTELEETPGLGDKLTKLLSGEKPEEKPKEETTEEDDKPLENATPAAQSRWAKMRQDEKWRKKNEPILTQLQQELETLRQEKAKTPEQEAARQAEIARAYKDRDALMEELRVSRVEATPEFREHITKPINSVIEQGKLIAKKYELSENSVVAALNETDSDRQGELLTELAATLSERDKVRLFTMGDQIADYQRQAAFIRSNAKVALEALDRTKKERAEKAQANFQEEWKTALDRVGNDFKAKLPLMQTVDGETEWNEGVKSIEDIVRTTDFGTMPAVQRAQILYQAAVLPRALRVQQTLLSENASLKKRIAKLTAATPGAGEGTPSGSGTPSIASDLGFLEAVEAA